MDKAINSTVLGVTSMSKTLPAVGIVLIVLFVVIKPEATAGYGIMERLLFWTAHISLGLGSLVLASKLLRPGLGRAVPLPAAIFVTGLAGVAMLAPVYVLLEYLMPAGLVEEPDSWLDIWAAQGPVQSVLTEFLEVTPMFLAAWFAVNLPLLLGRRDMSNTPPDRPPEPYGGSRASARKAKSPEADGDDPAAVSPAGSPGGSPDGSDEPEDDPAEQFFAPIPRALGRDVIAVSSDMHYLHVHTTRGKCMVLGTLRDATRVLGDAGLQVHRSHWVAHAHVTRIAKRGSAWKCVMSNDLQIPISRRNRTKVAKWYGSASNVVSMGSRKTG